MSNDPRFNFADSPGRLTEERFFSVGTPRETWQDALFRDRGNAIDSLEKLARSFGSFGNAKLNPVEKSILSAANETSTFDERTEVSAQRRTESVPVTEFLKVFTNSPSSSSGSSFSLHKSANPRVARVEKDVLDTGEISVSEYDESGKLIRGWISKDGSLPAMMSKTIVTDNVFGAHAGAPERVLLPPAIFSRRAITS